MIEFIMFLVFCLVASLLIALAIDLSIRARTDYIFHNIKEATRAQAELSEAISKQMSDNYKDKENEKD